MKTKLVILNGDFPVAVSRERIGGNSRMRMKIFTGLLALCLIGSFNFDATGQGRQSQSNAGSLVADKLHTPPKGSAERQAIMDALREDYNDRQSPGYQPHRGNITFVVAFLKVHNGWAWVYAEPHSSDPNDSFGENSGFLLRNLNGKWKLMALPPVVDDPNDPESLDYPTRRDVQRIKLKYPAMPTDIFPK